MLKEEEIDSQDIDEYKTEKLQDIPIEVANVTQYIVMLCLRYTELTRHLAGPG